MKTLEIFASQAVAALQSARQYEEIHRLTQLDPLTAAYNHRYFQDTLRKEIYRHHRLGHGLAVAMIDIDDFKAMNDTYGHPAGDAVLRGLVDELSVNVRDIDVVCRYGGEEFAIIFPETPADKALEVMKRLRACVAGREFPIGEDGKTVRITVSSGLAVYPQDGSTAVDLVGRADVALYEAKRQGKNTVVMSQSALAI
jgi:diguanylate cyclase (GGDEF)-like protein